MKCLPSNRLSQAHGNILHDWHAEIVAIRAFNRFLLDECLAQLVQPHIPSQWIVRRDVNQATQTDLQPFRIKDDVRIHMYCSEAPCGDASMELVMDAQEDATPWTSPPPTATPLENSGGSSAGEPAVLRGRSHFSLLGAVRLKPSRPDAPPTISKSCTDKLALKQCTSLLSSLTSLLISPANAYLTSLILPESQYVESACKRAFSHSGRMADISASMQQKWSGGYSFKPFEIKSASREFRFSRRSVIAPEKPIPCNLSAVYTPHFQETLIGGVLQGRKQSDARGASSICRRSIWKAAAEIAGIVGLPLLMEAVRKQQYQNVKESEMLVARRTVKEDVREVLRGWLINKGDENFDIGSEKGL